MPKSLALSEIDLIYAMGSLNSSGVGKNSGQSARPSGRGPGGWDHPLEVPGVLTEDKSSLLGTAIGGALRYRSAKSLRSCSCSTSTDADRAWLFIAVRASVLDFRGARFDSACFDCEASVARAFFSDSSSIGMAPSTGMSREEMKVAGVLLVKEAWIVLDESWAMLSDENRGDLPLREGVPLGVVEEGDPCIGHRPEKGFLREDDGRPRWSR